MPREAFDLEQNVVRVPQDEECHREQQADDHVAPERRKPQPQPVHNDVSARKADHPIATGQVNVPAP
jgi:hypothetical protein